MVATGAIPPVARVSQMIPDRSTASGVWRKTCTERRLRLAEDVLLFQWDVSLPHPVMDLELGPRVIRIEETLLATAQYRQQQQWRHDPRCES